MIFNFATIGRSHITSAFLSASEYFENFNLEAVYSRNYEDGLKFAEEKGAKKVYTSISEIANDPNINCVYIASPNSLHAKQAITLLFAKKHVLCEKPLATNKKEAEEMIKAARENGVLLMEAYKTFLNPNLYQVKKHLGKIGKIRNVFFTLAKYSTRYDAHKAGENVNTFKASLGGGAMADIGVYPLYPLLILFGKPKKIVSMSLPVSTNERDFPVTDGVTTAILDYETFLATINISKISVGYSYSEIQGEEGTIRFDNINNPTKMELVKNGKPEVFALPQKEFNMCYELEEFMSCIENGKTDPITFTNQMSLLGIEIIDEVRKNAKIIYPADLTNPT